MPTVEELDAKIEERRRQIAPFEEPKKALLAKEREQQKKCQTLVVSALGETVIREAGCTWTDIDLDCLQSWLDERAEDLHDSVVIEGQTPADAKRALDRFKKAQRRTQDAKGVEVEEPVGKPEIPETDDPEAVPVESDAETQASNLW